MISSTIGKGLSWSTWAAPAMLESKSAQCPRQHCCMGAVGADGEVGCSTTAPLVGIPLEWWEQQGPHSLQWTRKKWKPTETLGQKCCFLFFFFFSSSAGVCMSRAGVRSQPWCPSEGMHSPDPAGSVQLSRTKCLCSVARGAVQGPRQSSLKSVRAFPFISRTLD